MLLVLAFDVFGARPFFWWVWWFLFLLLIIVILLLELLVEVFFEFALPWLELVSLFKDDTPGKPRELGIEIVFAIEQIIDELVHMNDIVCAVLQYII
jgi:hypothetical protein